MDVGEFLRELGLQQYEVAFRDNRIDIRVLQKLTAEDLKELGVTTVGDRRLLLDAIAALREQAAPTGTAGGDAPDERRSTGPKYPQLPRPSVARSASCSAIS
jgi:hypothetical protein